MVRSFPDELAYLLRYLLSREEIDNLKLEKKGAQEEGSLHSQSYSFFSVFVLLLQSLFLLITATSDFSAVPWLDDITTSKYL